MVPFGIFLFNLRKIMNSHNSDTTVAFLEKIKKQAKKLLKLSKNNGLKIEIKTLSEAQNLLAQVNGYPDWHSLVSNLNNIINKFEAQGYNSEDMVTTNNVEKLFLQESEGIYSLHENNEITSFFELSTFPLDSYHDAKEWMIKFNHDIALKWNMQFHRVNILFNFCKNENANSEEHTFFKWSNIIGLSKEQFDDIFSIELAPQSTGFGLQVVCSVSTIEGMDDEHISFCKEFGNDFINKKFVTQEQYDSLLNYSTQKQIYFNESKSINQLSGLISLSRDDDSGRENLNWFYGLQFLYQKKTPIKLVAQISNNNQSLVVIPNAELPNNYIIFLKGLWSSLNQQVYGSFNIDDPINLIPITEQTTNEFNDGIPFINKTDGNIIKINSSGVNQYHQTNFIYAQPGSGKSVLVNSMNIDKILAQSKNGELPYVGLVDIGPGSRGMIEFLQNTLQSQYKEQLVYHKLTHDDVINPFDTELGCRYPSYMQKSFLSNFISLIVSRDNSSDNHFLSQYINHLITILYQQLADDGMPLKYNVGVNSQIDEIIKKIQYPITIKTTWWNVVDELFEHKYINEAKIAQRYANPTLTHIANICYVDELRNIYGKVTVTTGEDLLTYVSRNIFDNLKQFPNSSKITSLDLGDAKVISLDLDNLCKLGGVASEHISAINYALASFALVKHSKMYLNSMNGEKDIIPANYKQYYIDEIKKSLSNLASISFDEYHRVSSFNAMNNIVIDYLRNSRKFYFSFTIASQSLSDYLNLHDVCNNTFVYAKDLNRSEKTNILINKIKDKQVAAHLRNQNKLKHMDILFSSDTNQGKIEKIVSLKLNPFTLWTISTTSEDIYIREHLTKKLGYVNALKLLAEKYPYGVKKTVEIMLGDNSKLDRDDALANLLDKLST
jgi:hypothetical protein